MKTLSKSIAAAAALVASGVASAQVGSTSSDAPLVNLSGVSAKLGFGIPYDRDLNNGLGSTLTMVGLEYQLTRPLLRDSETYFSAEIYVRDYSGSRGYVLPITVNQRFYNTRLLSSVQRRQYAFIGLGFAILDNNNNGNGTDVPFVLHAGVGAELGERIFFELGGYFGENRGNARPNIVSISGGYRF